MPFAISKSVSLPKKMVPRTLNKPKEPEEHEAKEHEGEEQEDEEKVVKQKRKSSRLSIVNTFQDTEDEL
tara:strand:+ start:568 stop:774 length:207 start_codon:yes stop_codon:yes gene_type:complete